MSQENKSRNTETNPKKRHTGCLIVVVAVALFFLIPAFFGGSDEPSTPETEPEHIVITSVDLLKAYDENVVAADNAYKGKVLDVTGTVGNIGKDVMDRVYVTLKGEDVNALISVQCFFAEDDPAGVADLKTGDVVTITGICEGDNLNVTMKDSALVTE